MKQKNIAIIMIACVVVIVTSIGLVALYQGVSSDVSATRHSSPEVTTEVDGKPTEAAQPVTEITQSLDVGTAWRILLFPPDDQVAAYDIMVVLTPEQFAQAQQQAGGSEQATGGLSYLSYNALRSIVTDEQLYIIDHLDAVAYYSVISATEDSFIAEAGARINVIDPVTGFAVKKSVSEIPHGSVVVMDMSMVYTEDELFTTV